MKNKEATRLADKDLYNFKKLLDLQAGLVDAAAIVIVLMMVIVVVVCK